MARKLRWSLIAAWIVVGALIGIALSDPLSRWILLLIPVSVAAVWLLWTVGAGPESRSFLIGLTSWPILLFLRSRHHGCQVGYELVLCQTGAPWPWLLTVALLVLTAAAIRLIFVNADKKIS